METYKFYAGYTDIHKMCKYVNSRQIENELNLDFDPAYIQVVIPSNMIKKLFRKKFIIDKYSIHTPSIVIKVSYKNSKKIQKLIKQYSNVLSYDIYDGFVLMDIPLVFENNSCQP